MLNENDEIRQLWHAFESGTLSAVEVGQRILLASSRSHGPTSNDATHPDLDRKRRCGFPEVIYGQGKSPDAIRVVIEALLTDNAEVLVTRVTPEQVRTLSEMFVHTRWCHTARTLRVGREAEPVSPQSILSDAAALVAVVSAGTTDEPIAMEALETLAWMGTPALLIQDIGVAGPYRLLSHVPTLRSMMAIVCVAGMEGALPSVLAGHVGCPVVAVPTSVGYGANFAGLSALLGMLNSCAANVTVVNIDAGFKGGYVAGLIALQSTKRTSTQT